jgi:4-aminobutyrate aminotransferase-like enzyme
VLDVIEDEGLQDNALDVGNYIINGLWQLAETHDCIGDVRGSGLFLALELVTDRGSRNPARELTHHIVNDLRQRGVLTGSIGPDENIIKLRSPLVLSREDADYLLTRLAASLSSCDTG